MNESLNKYRYRRQFIAGSKFWGDEEYWRYIHITQNLKLSVHIDLPVQEVRRGEKTVLLLGYLIDPFQPELSDQDILNNLLEESTSFSGFTENTYRLSGRWAIIYVDKQQVHFFNDPFGMRQIYYAKADEEIWVGSEPAILSNCLGLQPCESDRGLLEFIHSESFKKKEHFWVGDKTRYREITHLLPNHYLHLNTGEVKRFWVNNEERYSVKAAAHKAAELLKKSLISANKRFELMMPVTAGWDSRVLLSASKEIKEDVFYFISTKNHLTEEDDDIRVPKKIFNNIGEEFCILDNLNEPDQEFLELLKLNVDLPRCLPKTLTFYEFFLHHQNKVNVNGRGGETVRSYYPFDKNPSADFLAKVTGYANDGFVQREIKNWLEEARPFASDHQIDLTDVYYWEQRMGNWGGTDPAEQDIAIEEFCPFNNRMIMMILLSTKRKYRIGPDYKLHKTIIGYLWSELLREPINPIPKYKFYKMLINSKIPLGTKTWFKKRLGIFPYN